METTKNTQYIKVPQALLDQMCGEHLKEKIRQRCKQMEAQVNACETVWLKLRDRDFYIQTKEKVLFPDTTKMQETWIEGNRNSNGSYEALVAAIQGLPQQSFLELRKKAESDGRILPEPFCSKICGLRANGMSLELARKLFDHSFPLWNKEGNITLAGNRKTRCVIITHKNYPMYAIVNNDNYALNFWNGAVVISVHEFDKEESLFDMIFKYGLFPEEFEDALVSDLKELHAAYQNGVDIRKPGELLSYVQSKGFERFLQMPLDKASIEQSFLNMEIDLKSADGLGAALCTYYEQCDYDRARIQKYHAKWFLSDEGRGHWDLWNTGEREGDSAEPAVKLSHGVIARNPLADVRHNAVVGIDFGTKSTIVAVQDSDDEIIPMRVGMADYTSEPKPEHYENPTVMQFLDLSRFLSCYKQEPGRPFTSWDDLKISHEAFAQMLGAKESREYASFLSDLKQWAAGRYQNGGDGHLIIRDAKGYRYDLNEYLKLSEEEIDPIELYSYYIGLFINNMHTGIYLDYILSFPETYSLEIRSRITDSFIKGIRHSLPPAVLQEESCAGQFRIRTGPSEPAAYAVCALEQYGIEPTGNGVFYGIFDFGGGTTDFDYGVWMNAPEEEYTYNYVIRHYGSGGDQTLGGENILQLLSYYLFSAPENLQIMREQNLVYFRPAEGQVFAGTEALTGMDESAILNTKQMMEALRPIWEENEQYLSWKECCCAVTIACAKDTLLSLNADGSAQVQLQLFTADASEQIQITLQADLAMVDKVIDERIEKGVRNFFEGLKNACKKHSWDEKNAQEAIPVFLAGNSSRSSRVAEFFLKYMSLYEEIIFGEKKEQPCRFVLYPPLGTKEAWAIQKERKLPAAENNLMAPTGKSGVAFGLIMCREGSMIRVESETKKNEQIKMNYYIGINYRKHFKVLFDREAEYGQWKKFIKVQPDAETFEFYYTELPEVLLGNVAIQGNASIRKRKCLIDQSAEGAFVYLRFVTPSSLEYAVGLEDAPKDAAFVSSVYKVDL